MMDDKQGFYKELSKAIKDGTGLQSLPRGTSSGEFISSFIKSSVEERKINDGLERQLQTQVIMLDPPRSTSKRENKKSTQLLPPGCRRLNAKQKKKLKLFQVPKEEQKYKLYLPLHSLWIQYMMDLLQVSNSSASSNANTMNQRVLKADYHGCSLTVSRSKCKSYIGIHGIVIQETLNTFKLICKDDKIRTVPKANSLFSFAVGKTLFTLRGTHLKYRPGDRSARKFKDKPLTVNDLQY